MKTKKKILSVLISFMLVIALMLSIGSTPALAAIDDVDVYGNSIDEFMDRFIATWWEHFQQNKQCPSQPFSFVFVDSQLLEFGFLDRLISFFEFKYNTTLTDFADVWRYTGVYFFIHQYDYVYLNITNYHLDLEENDEATPENYLWDFSDYRYYVTIYNYVGEVSMCGLGIWEFDSYIYSLMKAFQSFWNRDFKVYVIQRDPIVPGDDPLFLTIYNSDMDTFEIEAGSTPGVME